MKRFLLSRIGGVRLPNAFITQHIQRQIKPPAPLVLAHVAQEVRQLQRDAEMAGARHRPLKITRADRAVDVSQKVPDDYRAAVDVGIDQIIKRAEAARTNVESHGCDE